MPRLRALYAGVFVFAMVVASGAGCFAADRVVFARLGPTQGRLYISNADGSGERALTGEGSVDYNPSWSRDGKWILFTSERAGPADLYRVHPDGSGLARLTDDRAYDDQGAFASDGKKIVFVSTRGGGYANLWTLDLKTRKAKAVTTGKGGDFRPSWSPNGKWIAFSSDRDSDFPAAKGRWERLQLADIYLIHPDGSGLRRISKHGGFCGSPAWTADSKSVVTYCMSAEETLTFRFGNNDGETTIEKIDIASGEAAPVEAGPGVKVTPEVLASREIAYLRQDKTVTGVFYGKGTAGPKGNDLGCPAWSPDGAHVVYGRFAFHRAAEPVKQWSRDAKFELFSTGWLPDYDATGEHMAITKMKRDGTTDLLIVDEGKPGRAIHSEKGLILGPSWSPDGKQIAVGVGLFSAFQDFDIGNKKPVDPVNGGAQVGIVNADGSGFHLVTSGPDNNAFASFGPDGKHLVYRTSGPDGDGLRILNLEDHVVAKLTEEYDNFPIWSPRGDLIAFMRRIDGNFEIMTIHPDGTGLKQLTRTKGNEAHMAWSPDGERMLFTSSRMGFKDEAVLTGNPQPYGEIFVMKLDGTEVEQLTDDQWEEGGPAWQPRRAAMAAAK
jgi:TolB protein